MNIDKLSMVIISPRVSEKATDLEKKGQYVFRVRTDATKKQIAAAVKLMFNVDPVAVRVCNVQGKARRVGKVLGRCKNWKKAYVTLKEGQDINFSGA